MAEQPFSAGVHPAERVHPLTVQQLQDARLETTGLRSKSWDEFAQPGAPRLDFVFTLDGWGGLRSLLPMQTSRSTPHRW